MDRAGRAQLHYAALEDDLAAVLDLLDNGVSPDVKDKTGFTPLHLAAQSHAVRSATALLEARASVDAINAFGNTPLHLAVFNSNGRGEMIALLRSRGADPRLANSSGRTPIGLARLIANYDAAQYFADIDREQ